MSHRGVTALASWLRAVRRPFHPVAAQWVAPIDVVESTLATVESQVCHFEHLISLLTATDLRKHPKCQLTPLHSIRTPKKPRTTTLPSLGMSSGFAEACGDPDPNADDELLRVLLALIEDSLQGALPLLGTNDWSNIAGCLEEVKGCYPEGHEGLLERFARYGVVTNNTPILAKANVNLDSAARSLAGAMRNSRKAVKAQERSVAEAAEQSIESIAATTQQADAEAGDIKEGMDIALSLVKEQGDEAKAEMESLLEDLQERYGFTTGAVLGGSHETSAESERDLMKQHERTARWASISAAVLATAIVGLRLFGVGPSGIEGHLATVPFLGPVAVLLYIASVETRAASVHRHNAARWLGLSLQLKSLGPFIDDLARKSQPDSKGQPDASETPPEWRDTLIGEVLKKIFKGDIGPYTPPTRRSRRRDSDT